MQFPHLLKISLMESFIFVQWELLLLAGSSHQFSPICEFSSVQYVLICETISDSLTVEKFLIYGFSSACRLNRGSTGGGIL